MKSSKDCAVLLIEDNEDEVFFIRRAIQQLGFVGKFRPVTSVEDAMLYIQHEPPFADEIENPSPDLIVSDHGLRTATGLDVIRRVRAMPEHREVPIILYTSALSDRDAKRALQIGATACLTKAPDFRELTRQLREILGHLPEHCRWWKEG